jgi:hypothetical protein
MKKKPAVGIIAFICGGLALIGAVFGPEIAERISPTPPVEEKIADTVVRVRDAVVAKLKDRNAKIAREESVPSLRVRVIQASLGLAVLGMIGAGVSYSRHEDRRVAISAGAIALVGLAWQTMMVALGALVLCIIVALVLSKLDINPG